jgi:hypothetical protein
MLVDSDFVTWLGIGGMVIIWLLALTLTIITIPYIMGWMDKAHWFQRYMSTHKKFKNFLLSFFITLFGYITIRYVIIDLHSINPTLTDNTDIDIQLKEEFDHKAVMYQYSEREKSELIQKLLKELKDCRSK